MGIVLLHVLLPLLTTLALVGLYFTPVGVMGCANRGLAALGVAVVSAVAALATGYKASQTKGTGDGTARWWLISTAVLILPIVLLIWPLG